MEDQVAISGQVYISASDTEVYLLSAIKTTAPLKEWAIMLWVDPFL